MAAQGSTGEIGAGVLDSLYRIARPLLFRLDAETAHRLVFAGIGLVPLLAGDRRPDPVLAVKVAGLDWPSPVGLAAGLDKDGVGIPAWAALGFGAVEVGTVTALPQAGNPRPRLFRLVDEEGLVNRMGFNNEGAVALAASLARLRSTGRWPRVPVGANLGKSKLTPNEDAVGDYLNSVGALRGKVDYFVVNVSSPNTPGLRALQDKEPLKRLLDAVVPAAQRTPVMLKIAPDLEDDALAEAVDVAVDSGCAAIIATNTTTSRPGTTGRLDQYGGLSGKPLRPLSRAKIAVALAAARQRVPVIGVGGVSTADDVEEYLAMGCAAVQLYSALIFHGPGLVRRINDELAARRHAAATRRGT
ncbi:MAG: quinone-dependent dihydroorotate dehydrogenase [Deltaproteobacteria bacterium]|nr:quinone-dependent dihydroorotate dehydrogenase [Deltaproteobacteria bacterium]